MNNEEVHEVSEPSAEPASITEADLANQPTIFVTKTEWGGIEFGSNYPSLSLLDAIAMLEVAKSELVLQQLNGQQRERAKRQPQLLLPR